MPIVLQPTSGGSSTKAADISAGLGQVFAPQPGSSFTDLLAQARTEDENEAPAVNPQTNTGADRPQPPVGADTPGLPRLKATPAAEKRALPPLKETADDRPRLVNDASLASLSTTPPSHALAASLVPEPTPVPVPATVPTAAAAKGAGSLPDASLPRLSGSLEPVAPPQGRGAGSSSSMPAAGTQANVAASVQPELPKAVQVPSAGPSSSSPFEQQSTAIGPVVPQPKQQQASDQIVAAGPTSVSGGKLAAPVTAVQSHQVEAASVTAKSTAETQTFQSIPLSATTAKEPTTLGEQGSVSGGTQEQQGNAQLFAGSADAPAVGLVAAPETSTPSAPAPSQTAGSTAAVAATSPEPSRSTNPAQSSPQQAAVAAAVSQSVAPPAGVGGLPLTHAEVMASLTTPPRAGVSTTQISSKSAGLGRTGTAGSSIRSQGTESMWSQATPIVAPLAAKPYPGAAQPAGHTATAAHESHKIEDDGGTNADAGAGLITKPTAGEAASTQLQSPVPASADAGALPAGALLNGQPVQPASPAASAPDGQQEGQSLRPETLVADAPAPPDAHALPSINTARVIQSMQGSEMRVGMHSAEFGQVSVSTAVDRQSIAAQISFEHVDLGKALAAHVPGIEAKLSSDYGVHAKVEVRDQSMGSFGGESSRGDSRRGDGSSPGGEAGSTTNLASLVNRPGPSTAGASLGEAGEWMGSGSRTSAAGESARLDIRA